MPNPVPEEPQQSSSRPPIWQMVREAMRAIDRDTGYGEIKEAIWKQYPDVKSNTLTCQIIICCVNHPSRIHYPENKHPRLCTGQYDFLYYTSRGRVEPYDRDKHGLWEIALGADGHPIVRIADEILDSPLVGNREPEDTTEGFALESHLRDYLAQSLPVIPELGSALKLYTTSTGIDGVEFQTDVGPIDILAVTATGDFVVFELKLGRGPDAALGQLQRYMGWVQHHLAKERKVWGIVLASEISQKLKYAATQAPKVRLLEYDLHVTVRPVGLK